MPENTETNPPVGRLYLKVRVGRGQPGIVLRPPGGPEIRVSVAKTQAAGRKATVAIEAPRDVVVLRETLLQPKPSER